MVSSNVILPNRKTCLKVMLGDILHNNTVHNFKIYRDISYH